MDRTTKIIPLHQKQQTLEEWTAAQAARMYGCYGEKILKYPVDRIVIKAAGLPEDKQQQFLAYLRKACSHPVDFQTEARSLLARAFPVRYETIEKEADRLIVQMMKEK